MNIEMIKEIIEVMILIITDSEDEKCKGTEESRKEENRIDDKIDNRSNNDPSD